MIPSGSGGRLSAAEFVGTGLSGRGGVLVPDEAEVGAAAGDQHGQCGDYRQAARPWAWLAVPALAEDVIHRHPPLSERWPAATTIRGAPGCSL